jgi:hypothetical protein
MYLLLSALVVFLIFYSSLSKFIKAAALSVSVLLGVVTQNHYVSQLGKPIEAYPVGEFVYVHHVTVGNDIVLWTWTEDVGDRLYSFPYSQETAEKLEEAKEESEGGQEQSGEFTTTNNGNHEPGLIIDRWDGQASEETK